MSSRDEYVRKLQTKLEEWNSDIDALSARASEVATEVKHEYNEQIEVLKTKQAEARQKIEELQKAGENAWVDLKAGIELAKTAMGEAIDSARARFK
ncbi:MAG: hypothetical protein A2091_04030 [Desulfuromonadales bacterium GWD2_61_12]|nr:MAG: hypothetical protein A2005_01575 [Desulfuromonadales bacterium GWC2_61_20]OGR34364.1 MAG: hypothetical protein A2091_04030 [Desulfuromonadales bacterium GWD2_61_12]HAD04007.1 hypothetical protein [Desulfuromonas sp.]